MATIGTVYRLDCPIEDNVPVYLIMSGMVSMLILVWLILTQLDIRFVTQLEYYVKMHQIQWFLMSTLLVWCGLGCYFVLPIAFPKEHECEPVLYRLAFFVVTAQILMFVIIVSFCIFCGSACCRNCTCCKRETTEEISEQD